VVHGDGVKVQGARVGVVVVVGDGLELRVVHVGRASHGGCGQECCRRDVGADSRRSHVHCVDGRVVVGVGNGFFTECIIIFSLV